MNWSEFKPTIWFLGKFLGLYFVGSLLYGLYVTAYEPEPDPVTRWVTVQSSGCLRLFGFETSTLHRADRPTTAILNKGKAIVSVYEGCNGINVAIIFVSFLFAFGPIIRSLAWFIPLGLAILHIGNLLRIMLLFWVTLKLPHFVYFMHKYLFTAIIYVVVFVMWVIWVRKFAIGRR